MVAGCQLPAAPGAATPAPATPASAAPATSAPRSTSVRDAVVYGVASEPKLLNPLLANDGASASVTQIRFEPLVATDAKTGSPVPALADRWDQSADGLTYTFHIRSNVAWSDGQPLRQALTYALDRAAIVKALLLGVQRQRTDVRLQPGHGPYPAGPGRLDSWT